MIPLLLDLIKDIIFSNADFNIQLNDLAFFEKLLKTEPNENQIIFKNSNIFYENKFNEILFINKISNSRFFYDSNNLQNVLISDNKISHSYCKKVIKPTEQEIENHKLFLKTNLKKNYF